jgi:hypothetical protein
LVSKCGQGFKIECIHVRSYAYNTPVFPLASFCI